MTLKLNLTNLMNQALATRIMNNTRSTSTIMKNRIAADPLKSDKDMKKLGRGAIDLKVTKDKKLCLLKWQDNKSVFMMSSNDGKEPVNMVKRWSKIDKKYVTVPQPNAIKAYNTNIGGGLIWQIVCSPTAHQDKGL
uniref:PiggyBac transposable element-derived protein domain-containing protein n=1 Tax=Graphocephala atropunctata TaxID=36148 RepID=A0A1B6KGI6_9HEMI